MICVVIASGVPQDIKKITQPIKRVLIKQSIIGSVIGLCIVCIVILFIHFPTEEESTATRESSIIFWGLMSYSVAGIIIAIYYDIVPSHSFATHQKVTQNTNDFLQRKNIATISQVTWESFISFLKIIIDNCFSASQMIITTTLGITFVILVSIYRLTRAISRGGIDRDSWITFGVGAVLFCGAMIGLFITNKKFIKIYNGYNAISLLNIGYTAVSRLAVRNSVLAEFTKSIMKTLKAYTTEIKNNFNWHSLGVGVFAFVGAVLLFLGLHHQDEDSNHLARWLPTTSTCIKVIGMLSGLVGGTIALKKFIDVDLAIQHSAMELDFNTADKLPAGNKQLDVDPNDILQIKVKIKNPYTGSKMHAELEGNAGISFIVGQNGSGKSTSAQCISGAYGFKPGQLEIIVNGNSISATNLRGGEVSKFIAHQTQSVKPEHLRIRHLLAAYGFSDESDLIILEEQINNMLLEAFGDERMHISLDEAFGINHMSGGERQILLNVVAIVATINNGNRYMILDEITQNLSQEMARKIMRFLGQIAMRYNIHLIIISHDNIRDLIKRRLFPADLPVRVITLKRNKEAKIVKLQ
jgi:ABC-type cobalamin/Fe3+-siderophores transport system ATPase subunit/multisubunit Na+/H+ antiporter MnhB subunit